MNEQDTASTPVSAPSAPAGNVPGVAHVGSLNPPPGAAATTPMPKTISTVMGDFVAGILSVVARGLNPSLIESSLAGSKRVGHYAVLAGGGLTLAYAIFGAIKFNSFAIFAIGLGFVVALAVAQFAAIRFLGASDTIIASTPSRLSSAAFLDCVGLLSLLVAAAIVLGGIAGAIAGRSFLPIIPAVLSGFTLTCFGAIALHPRVVNVATGEGTAGEEAIGLFSFFFKSALKLVPLLFLLFSAVGALAIVVSFFGEGGALAGMARSIVNAFPFPVQVPVGLTGSALVLVACLVPIIAYFVFLLQYLFVDVLRAVLSVPAKLDALRR